MRTLILACSLSAVLASTAQGPVRLWGMTASGGANNKGTVFSVNADGTDFTTVFNFTDGSGWGPEGGLCYAPNGLLYGMTMFGGEAVPAAGTLFTIDPSNGTFSKLRDFNISNGGYCWGSLIVGNDGMLYGAGYGGSDGGGSIFRVNPANNEYTELFALDQDTHGAGITGDLIQASDGMLYGTGSQGGANSQSGTLFRYDPVADVFTNLHDFDGAAGGRTPYGGVTQAGNGWLYGTTYESGLNNHGTVFKYDPVNDVFETIANIDDLGGSNCWNKLLRVDADLLVAGVANGGLNSAGFLFTVTPSTDAVAAVCSFAVNTSGTGPVGSLISTAGGNIYGMNSLGGTGSYGTVYHVDLWDNLPTVLHAFTLGADGGIPRGELVALDPDVSVNEHGSASPFSIGPNPSDGTITVRCDVDQLPVQARLMDATGRVLRVFSITGPSDRMDVGDEPGVRLLELLGRSASRMERVIVN